MRQNECVVNKAMAQLWPDEWYEISDKGGRALANVGYVWRRLGLNNLQSDDVARLEPFLEPFDAVYNDDEITILSRLGHNGLQKEYCRMYQDDDDDVWVIDWYLSDDDCRRAHLTQVANLLFPDDPLAIVHLTRALTTLRTLRVSVDASGVRGETDHSLEQIVDQSLEQVEVDEEE